MPLESIDDLKPADYNPRKLSKKAAAGLAASIARFGDISGITWNKRTGNLVCGHQRMEQLRAMGARLVTTEHGAELLVDTATAAGTPAAARFNLRVVDWDLITEQAANVAANNPNISGQFTSDVLGLLENIKAGIGDEDFKQLQFDDMPIALDDDDIDGGPDEAHAVEFLATDGDDDDDAGVITGTSDPLAELQAPFPWFGGKRRVYAEVWRRFGDVGNYVEPFFGSGATMLGRPHDGQRETINDLDGYVANFWRAIKHDPSTVAAWANNPVNENDLHARHSWLVGQRADIVKNLEGDPDWCDPKIAGWWVWGICCWIGGGFCSGKGPWQVNAQGQLVHLGDDGRGVTTAKGSIASASQDEHLDGLVQWFTALSKRLRRVRVCSGDWSRVVTPSVTIKHGLTGVFLDPPYADTANRTDALYTKDSLSVAHDVRRWAIENGEDPLYRIALCGYEGEHQMPASWATYAWRGPKGMATDGGANAKKERIWFSPACLKP